MFWSTFESTAVLAGGALPSGGHFVAGQGAINSAANGLVINQSSTHGIVNWQNFSIGKGNTVQFNNGTGATLNRVTGGNLSQIDGLLKGTGSVYVINPQGVVVGDGGKVITGGSFIGSTRDVSNDSFMSGGALTFSGTSNGSITNNGTITSANGDVVLVGKSVSNNGAINASNGTAGLAAGDQVVLQPVNGDQRIAISAGTGSVTNSGDVSAAAAELKAANGNVYALAGSSGVVRATGTQTINGHVWLTANGDVNVKGAVTAANATGSGGAVTVRGSNINVSGQITASATKAGQSGGNVSVIAKNATQLNGTIKAEGGQGSTGGFVETSGGQVHVGDDVHVSTLAPGGITGTWLIDPPDFTIAASGGDISGATLSSELATTDITLNSSDGTVNTNGNGDIFVNDAVSWSSTHSLTLNAARNIEIGAGISLVGGTLNLNASGAIDVNSTVHVTGGGTVNLAAGSFTPTGLSTSLLNLNFNNSASIDFGATNNGAKLFINGTQYMLLYSYTDMHNNMASGVTGAFALATSISGGTYTNPYLNMYSGGIFEGLGHVMDGGTFNFNSGGIPDGLFGENDGTIRDFGITNATFNGGGFGGGALVANMTNGTIANSYFTGTFTDVGGSYSGGLVGSLRASFGNSNIYNSWTNASITAGANGGVGGLVGRALNTNGALNIVNSYALGSVTGGRNVGGLIGTNSAGALLNDYATGNVIDSGTSGGSAAYAGGLIGENDSGTITNSYATGNVSGGYNSGGLVGYFNGGGISTSYATGDVAGGGDSASGVGGLIGASNGYPGTIDQVYALGSVSNGYYAGGLVGNLTGGMSVTNAFAAGSVTGSYAVGGLAGYVNGGGYPGQNIGNVLSIGAVNGGSYQGAVVGYGGPTFSSGVLFDSDTTGTTVAVGSWPGGYPYGSSTGLHTADLQNGTLPGSLDSSIWGAQSGAYPYLKTFFPSGVQVLSGTAINANSASIAVADGGYRVGKGSVGANGYFYMAMQPGSITAGDNIVIYNALVNPGGVIESAPASLTGLSYTGGILIAPTSATTATAADAGITALAGTVLAHDANGAAVLASVTDHGYIASGSSFDLNESITGPVYVKMTAANAALTVSAAQTVSGSLTLQSTGALNINAPITASGKVVATLGAGIDTFSLPDLIFGDLGKLDFGATNQGSTLSVNGTNYSLLYSMANLVATGGSGTYALATGITAGSYSNNVLATQNAGALFEGLGNSITGLTITNHAVASNVGLGLFGTNNGAIRDLHLVNESVTGGNTGVVSTAIGGLVGINKGLLFADSTTGTVNGDTGSATGGLVGLSTTNNGKIYNSWSSANVALPGTSGWPVNYAGGLVGESDANTIIANSYAIGTVTALASSSAGGLVGSAAGAVTGSYATGAISGGTVGGLIGTLQNNGLVSSAYATGNVISTSSSYGYAGGLVGSTGSGSTIDLSHASGTVQASGYTGTTAGGLVGYATGAITNSYATGAVSNAGDIGGLVGRIYTGASLNNDYATGSVSDSSTSNYISAGGLVGESQGSSSSITNSYATGNVTVAGAYGAGGLIGQIQHTTITGDYATGDVYSSQTGGYAGGLVGYTYSGSISNSFATGAVSAPTAGGLVGLNAVVITNAYATGAVSGIVGISNYNRGGVIGYNNYVSGSSNIYATGKISTANGGNVGGIAGTWGGGAPTNAYFDTGTTGMTYAYGNTTTGAMTTAAFQSGSLPNGFDSSVWSTGSGLYPYLTSFFPGGVQAISGTASGAEAALVIGGASQGHVSIGANGYYYFAVPTGAISGLGSLSLLTVDNTAALLTTLNGQTSGVNIAPNALSYTTANTSYAASYGADRATALGWAGTPSFVSGLDTILTATGAGFALDQAVNLSGGLTVNAGNAPIIVTAPVTAANLTFNTGSSFDAGAALTGAAVKVSATGAITLGDVNATTLLATTSDGINLHGVITASGAGDAVVLSAGTNFVNNTGSGAIALTGGGRWLIYSSAPGGDTFNNLDSTNYAVWDATYGGTISQSGNRYVFAEQPTATISAGSDTKVYGDTENFTSTILHATGLDGGVVGAYLGDTIASIFSSLPTASSDGAVQTANVGSYDVTLSGGTASSGYAITLDSTPGTLIVTKRALTVRGDAMTRSYGDANPTAWTATGDNLVNGDVLSQVDVVGSTASATSNAGSGYSYSIDNAAFASGLASNYQIIYLDGGLTITPRVITVIADTKTKSYGDANPALTFSTSDLGAGTALVGSLSTSAGNSTGVGHYFITQGDVNDANNPNYDIGFVANNLTITARPITVTADALTKTYGDANPLLTFQTSSLGFGAAVQGTLDTGAGNASDVGNYGITQGTVDNAHNGNYAISYVGADLTIGKRSITVTADAQTKIYGNANPALTFQTSGLGYGAAVQGSLDTPVDNTTGIGTYAITQGTVTNATNSNYDISFTGANFMIDARPITITADDKTKDYGDANPTLTETIGGMGLVNGDTLTGSLATTAGNTSGVGAYGITQGTREASANYTVTFNAGTLNVVPRAITVTADAKTKVYGEANPALTFTTSDLGYGVAVQGSLDVSADNTTGIGSYGITQGSVVNTNNPNYDISYTGSDLTISARPITITADDQTKVYGNANPTLTETVGGMGLVNGDALTGALATAAGNTSDVGTYGITQGTRGASANYAVTYTPGTLSVTARPITVTANALSKIYGEANPALTFTTSSLGYGVAVQGSLDTAADNTTGIGSYAITQGSVTNATNSNYDITYVGANLGITVRPITVTADDKSKIYGDANPALTETIGGMGLVNGDTLTGSLATSVDGTTGVGSYGITQGTRGASANYDVTFTSGTLSVTARPITITADNKSKTYGDANPALTETISGMGLVNGDTLTGSLTTTADNSSGVGGYAITQGTRGASANYDVTFVSGLLNIGQRALTITGDLLTRLYGDANPASWTATGDNLINGDTISSVDVLSSTASATSNVGSGYSYAIGNAGFSHGLASNYAITYADGGLTINVRPITVTANALTKTYGDTNPALTFTTSDLGAGAVVQGSLVTTAGDSGGVGAYAIAQGDVNAINNPNYAITYVGHDLTITPRAITVTADAKTKTYGDANPALTFATSDLGAGAAVQGSLDTTAGDSSNVGAYAIEQGDVNDINNPNYTITYVGHDLTITARPITVTADALTKIYGDANPALTFMTSNLGAGAAVQGSLDTVAGDSSDVGNYAITAGSVTNASNPNYDISYVGHDLTITQRPITVTADAKTKTYGDANPALTFATSNLGAGVAVQGALDTAAGDSSDVGSYGIIQGTVINADNPNYDITYVGANLDINVRPIMVTADALTKTYGDTNPALTFTTSDLGAGVAVQGALDTAADETTGVGAYGITQGSVTDGNNGNYAITYVGNDMTITARPITVTADALTRTYGDANPALTYTISSGDLVNGDLFGGMLATAAGATSNVGSYAIDQGTFAASSNYALTYVAGTLSVTARPVTVTADNLNRIYGDANPTFTYTVGGRGLVNGDTLAGALASAADGTSNVSLYAIAQGTLAASSNYTLTYAAGTLSVTARPVTVTAGDASRVYGSANPAFTYTIGGDGLVNGDTLTGALATVADAHTNVGHYAIKQGTLAGSANYALAYVPGTLAVTPAPLTIDADDISSPTLATANATATYLGLVAGDDSSVVTGLLFGFFPITNDPRDYDIVPFGASAANYDISYLPGLLTLAAQPPSVFTAPLIIQGGLGTLPSLVVTTGGGAFSFSNVATASIGDSTNMVLFGAGLPGQIGGFSQIVISDYSNATDDSDRLVTQ